MKLSGQELYNKLVNEYKIIGEKGIINFSLKNLTISIDKNGNTNWKQDTKFAIRTEPLFINNSLYIINDDKKIMILDNKTGKIQDEILTKAQVKSGAISYKKINPFC